MQLKSIILITSLFAFPVCADPVETREELEVILDDQIILEDYESFSVHSGSWVPMPNPLNAANSNEAVLEGVTYTSEKSLHLVGGFLSGDDDVYLRSDGALTIEFDEPQIGFGFNFVHGEFNEFFVCTIVSSSGSVIQTYTHRVNDSVFFGYTDEIRGILSIRIESETNNRVAINDLAFGAEFFSCPADLNDDQSHNFFDVSLFLSYFNDKDDRADLTDDGDFNFFDISAFLQAFQIGCP